MALTTFIWHPDMGATHTSKPNVLVSKYGDGYEQRVGDGINTTLMVWSLKYSKPTAEASQIITFLRERGGQESFNWTNPLGETGTYVCREFKSSQISFGIYEVTGDFEQVFE